MTNHVTFFQSLLVTGYYAFVTPLQTAKCVAVLPPCFPVINSHDILQKRINEKKLANKDRSAAKKWKVVMLEVKFEFSPLHSHSRVISNASAILLNRFSTRSLLITSIPNTLVQATVTSYLDYCNSLTGLPISTFASSFNMFSLDQPE